MTSCRVADRDNTSEVESSVIDPGEVIHSRFHVLGGRRPAPAGADTAVSTFHANQPRPCRSRAIGSMRSREKLFRQKPPWTRTATGAGVSVAGT